MIGKGRSLKTVRFVCHGSGMPWLKYYVEHSKHDIIFFSHNGHSLKGEDLLFSNNLNRSNVVKNQNLNLNTAIFWNSTLFGDPKHQTTLLHLPRTTNCFFFCFFVFFFLLIDNVTSHSSVNVCIQ